jgi:hypothetical protein
MQRPGTVSLLSALYAHTRAGLQRPVPPPHPALSPTMLLTSTPAPPPPLQVPVDRPTFQETTSLGAALAAGLAVGFWSQAQVFQYPASKQLRFTPAVSVGNADRRFAKWRKAVGRCLDLADLVEEDDEQSRAASPEGPVEEV